MGLIIENHRRIKEKIKAKLPVTCIKFDWVIAYKVNWPKKKSQTSEGWGTLEDGRKAYWLVILLDLGFL